MDVFNLIGGPKQLPLYAFLIPIPIVLFLLAAGFRDVVRGTPNASAGERLLYFIDSLSTSFGKTYAWCIVILTFTTSYEVFARYMFGAPTDWAFDAAYMLYGTLFMVAGAYALSRNSHVRGDFIYRAWPPRVQAGMDFVLFILFFFPGMLAFVYSGYGFAEISRRMNEHSAASPDGPIVWPFKWLISIVGCMMVLQGLVELTRCVMTLRTGEWPQRLHDVEELEKVILAKAEHGDYQVVKELEELGVKKGDI
ncbi:MAG TPA: TRAP transporter small permease subunit [Xanthobacteraceae bacterium]|nr:TRAP transporter small permease subunit [Xanthobacteraceae bacterium]